MSSFSNQMLVMGINCSCVLGLKSMSFGNYGSNKFVIIGMWWNKTGMKIGVLWAIDSRFNELGNRLTLSKGETALIRSKNYVDPLS